MQLKRVANEVKQMVSNKICDNSIKGTIISLPTLFLIPFYLDAYICLKSVIYINLTFVMYNYKPAKIEIDCCAWS